MTNYMKYYAYGSNMSLQRMQKRLPGAKPLGRFTLEKHVLKFHKINKDGSGKCDACFTGRSPDRIHGVLYEILSTQKTILDSYEGLGFGYDDKIVTVRNQAGQIESAVTYYATKTDSSFKPYTWYKEHVMRGAIEAGLPGDYLEKIRAVDAVPDPDRARESRELKIYKVS